MGNLEYFTLGRRNMAYKNHWEELPSDLYRITKPTVLCFGGNGTITSREANAMCKIAQGLVGLKLPSTKNEFATATDVDFVGIGYGRNQQSLKETGGLTEAEKDNFVKNIFINLCINEDGKILPNHQIIKNFNQITFFTHCYGSNEVSSLIGRTYRNMLKLGIDDTTANNALDQMFAVSYAPYNKCACPNLQVIPMKDIPLRTGAKDSEISKLFIESRLQSSDQTAGTVAYKEDDITASVLVSGMLKRRLDEHPIFYASRNENWQFIKSKNAEFGDEVSQVMGYALASSISNSIQNQHSDTFTPKPSIDQVLEDAQSILGKTTNPEFENYINQIKMKLNEPSIDASLTSGVPDIENPLLNDNTQNIDYASTEITAPAQQNEDNQITDEITNNNLQQPNEANIDNLPQQ